MPTLDWIGKSAVVNHHRKVPYHLLRCDRELSAGDADAGNLLVQGDNLLALKALLPYYAGKVKCIYIDPPYNTGFEGWVYNDNANSLEIRQWLRQTVGKEGEDLSRHDKWLCMMYPRLILLRDFLAKDGILAVSIDDNELSLCGILLDTIFGPKNRLACAPWLAEPSGGKEKTGLRSGHEFILIYHGGDITSVTQEQSSTGRLNLKDKWGNYRKGRELRKWGGVSHRKDRPGQWYPLQAPDGTEVWPIRNDGEEGHWRWGKNQKMREILKDTELAHWELRPFDEGVSWNGHKERWVPYEKIRDAKKSVGWNTWLDTAGFNSDATRELKAMFGSKPFETPKPTSLLEWIIGLHADENALVLDSFAGSGTTAHAVLKLNNSDDGSRRFICIEMDETICRDVTARRVRKAIEGYGDVPGLGGGFRFCKLGGALFDEAGNIADEVSFGDLAAHVFFTETGSPLPKRPRPMGEGDRQIENSRQVGNLPYKQVRNQPHARYSPLLGVHQGRAVYLLFNGVLGDRRPAGGNVLTHEVAQSLPQHPNGQGLRVVYGEACRLGPKSLARYGIVFRQVPFELKVE